MEDKALVAMERTVVNIEEYAMSADRLLAQVSLLQKVMHSVMKENEHYGVIPGCKKPSLYKPGAEKLGVTFRLVPHFDIKRSEMPNGHREYEVICHLMHAPTGQSFGDGVGSCSTMEAKYRYRTGESKLTDKPVPKAYWDDPARSNKHLGGAGFTAKKDPANGRWVIAIQGEKVEHENPADYYNTVLKMAKKRSHVDAILTATAASDIFTQDVEDMAENGNSPKETHASTAKTLKEPEVLPSETEVPPMTEQQRRKLWSLMKEAGLSEDDGKSLFAFVGATTKKSASVFIENFDQAIVDWRKANSPTEDMPDL